MQYGIFCHFVFLLVALSGFLIAVLYNTYNKLSTQSGDDRETSFLFQRLSVLIQRFNAILLHSFVKEEEE